LFRYIKIKNKLLLLRMESVFYLNSYKQKVIINSFNKITTCKCIRKPDSINLQLMKKTFGILFLLSMFASAYAGRPSESMVCEGFNYLNIRSKIQESESKFTSPKGDLVAFKNQISGFHDLGLISIPVTESLINKYLNTFSKAERDSVYVIFNDVVYSAINDFNDSIELKYFSLLRRNNKKIVETEISEFKRSLDMCGLTLLQTEGENYVDVKCDYYYKLFKGRVSPALNDYLKIRLKELRQGFSEDAELIISFHQLYRRVLTWEKFNKKYPGFFNIQETQLNYATYLSTLITGMDNSPVFDYDSGKLFPLVHNLYLKIISRHDSLKSTRVIKEYYELLKASDYTRPDHLDKFLTDNELFSMVGVQPENR